MQRKIIRVFPHKNSYTPTDDYAFYGEPQGLFPLPEHDEIHISCTFTWDKAYCEHLAFQYEVLTNKPVKLGGVAYNSPSEDFIQGMYVKPNIIFTSRGCNNNCPWCIVPKLEGTLKELPVCEGNIIQDNNFLQTSRQHKDKVFEMLKKQHGICFKGGLEPDLIDEHFLNGLLDIGPRNIKELWLACDTDSRIPYFKRACEKLQKIGLNRNKIHCYVLSYGKDREKDEARAVTVYEAGAMPFVQLYRDFSDNKTEYNTDWNAWARSWQCPAAIRAHMEQGTNYKDFNT